MESMNNPTIHFAFLRNKTDSSVVHTCEWTWDKFAEALTSGHLISEDKDVDMFGPWRFKTKSDDYIPRTTKDGELFLVDGEPVVGRFAENVVGVSMICLDFDGDITIDFAKHKFAQYAHVGYTSYRHKTQEKDGRDCFRIVLPLIEEVTPEEFMKYRKSLYEWAVGVDQSSLSLARCFYMPSCSKDRVQFSQSWINHGYDLLNIKEFDREADYIAPVAEVRQGSDEFEDTKRRWIVDALSSIHVGYEPTWYSIAVAMHSCGFSYNDFVKVTMSGLMHQKTERDCASKWKAVERSGRTGSVGFLINLLKKHGMTMPDMRRQNMLNRLSKGEV